MGLSKEDIKNLQKYGYCISALANNTYAPVELQNKAEELICFLKADG